MIYPWGLPQALTRDVSNLNQRCAMRKVNFAPHAAIGSFERIRREDWDEIRSLQRRIEDLIGETTLLKKASSGNLNERSCKARSLPLQLSQERQSLRCPRRVQPPRRRESTVLT